MKISLVKNYVNYKINNTDNSNRFGLKYNCLTNDTFTKSVSFGWCELHQARASEVSQIFNEQLRFQNKEAELKQKAGALLDIANKTALEATKFVINYANKMKGEAEFVPLWTIKNTPKLQESLDASPIFGDPVQNLIGLKNIGKFKMNNPKYSDELNNQGAGSLQVHTAIIFTEQAERNINKANLDDADKQEVQALVQIVKNKIDEVFGKGAYAQLIEISNMGNNPTTQQKRESLDILKRIDSMARRFDFGEDFNQRVEALVEKLHVSFHHEHEHVHHDHVHGEVQSPEVEIIYHSHGLNGEHEHEHEHEHKHEHVHEHIDTHV